MLDYKLIESLAMVCQEGGFEKAARSLCLTQSAVSQRVRQLEDRLGLPVVVRGTPPEPTEMGSRLIAHYHRVRQLERDLEEELPLALSEDFLTLAIGVNEDSMATWFTSAVGELARARRYALHISVDDQDETHKLLKMGKVVGCTSTRSEPIQGCAVVYLGRVDYVCLASPSFAEEWFPRGLDSDAARRAPAVLYSPKDRSHQRFLEQALENPPEFFPHHFVPSSHGFIEAVRGGLGYGLLPHLQAGELLTSGRVVDVAPGVSMGVHLYWHHWDLKARATKELTAALVRYARSHLPQHEGSPG